MSEISLKPELLFLFKSVQFTNTLVSSIIIFSLLAILLTIFASKFNANKPSSIQLVIEMVVDMLGKIFTDITATSYRFSLLFSFVFSFFIFILFSNWFGLLPFVGPFGLHKVPVNVTEVHAQEPSQVPIVVESHEETNAKLVAEESVIDEPVSILSCIKERHCILTTDLKIIKTEHFIPLFRAPTSDLSVTLVLALLSVFAANALGFTSLGFSYFKKYFNFSNGMNFAVGILELISEIGKIISFSFRLFGNVFAGEVLLVVIGFISYGIASLPFMGLEFFIGMIQALVFFMLTTVFVSLAKSQHH